MSFDTIIRNGTVVDGSGLPKRVADVGIRDGVITDIGRLSGAKRTIDAEGLVVMPGIVDAHTHYDPQLTFEPFATSSCFHGVTSVVGGNCGYSIAPVKPADHGWVTKLFAKVEGMSPRVLDEGLPWDWDTFPSLLEALDKRLGINAAIYVGHSALRRWVMGEAASERKATADEVATMQNLVREAMRAGAAGFTSSHAPTHVDPDGRPVPSRHADFDEVLALAAAAGEGGAGSIGFLARTAVQGYDAEDRARVVKLAHASGLPVVVQGMGYRPGQREMWDNQTAFLADARRQGAAVFSMLRTQPFMRPFNWKRGTSLFDGVFHWRDVQGMTPEQKAAKMKEPAARAELRWGLDNPNKDPEKGSTLPPPAMTALFVDRSRSDPAAEGKSLAQLAKERGVHPADVMCELAVADGLETQFLWNSESPAWIEANGESHWNPHMIIGTGDGGAHADRDDGAEWSTYFLRAWLLDREHMTLEEGVRRITHLPAMVCGMPLRGLLARGYHADIMMFDPARIRLGKKQLVADMPGGEDRWQVKPEGIVRVLVNGEVIVENGELTGSQPGRVLRIGERVVKGVVFHGPARGVAIEDVTVRDPGPGEVRVAIRAAGLCHSDQSVINGTIPYPVPVVLGHEGAGIVESVGPGVTSVKEGDAVILSTLAHCGRCPACEGGKPTACRNAPNPKDVTPFSLRGAPAYQFANASAFAELTLVREQSAIPVDPRVPFDRAALIGCGIMTGVGAVLNRARVEAGASMAVFGVGGIGLNCVQGGVLAGAAQIIAVDVNPQKLELARSFGATHVVDAGRDDALAAVRDLTHGGADYTFECVGNLAVIRQALDAVAPGGTLTIVGVPRIGSTMELVVHSLYNNKGILGCRYGAARPRRDFPMLADLYLAGRLRIDELITDRYPLDDFDRALHDLEDGRLARGVFQLGPH